MNKKKYGFVAFLLLAMVVISVSATGLYVQNEKEEQERQKLTIVTSFYPMYIATANIVDGCENVALQNLSEPQTGCLHDYQLTPEDMKLISGADALIVNGGHVEPFLYDVKEAYPELPIIEAGAEVEMLGENGHMWMDTEAYRIQVRSIAKELGALDPAHADRYKENAEEYCDKIAQLENAYHNIKHHEGTSVILLHEGYEYLAAEWGLDVAYTLNLDEKRKVSAKEVASVLEAIREHGVSMILAEEQYGSKLAETVCKETDVQVLYLDTCVRGEYEKDAYLNAMKQNLEAIAKELHHEDEENH